MESDAAWDRPSPRARLFHAVVGVLLAANLIACEFRNNPAPCEAPSSYLRVQSAGHTLAVCARGRAVAMFSVRLGVGGLGKRREGDRKTPLGTYALGESRKSLRYGMFIPIAYPTASQRARGYSGGSLGIHGPDRKLRWLGTINNWFDTTDGCIGLASDGEMSQLIAWIRDAAPRVISID